MAIVVAVIIADFVFVFGDRCMSNNFCKSETLFPILNSCVLTIAGDHNIIYLLSFQNNHRSVDLPICRSIHPSIIDHKENEKHQRVMDNGTKTLTFERLKPAHWNTKHRDADWSHLRRSSLSNCHGCWHAARNTALYSASSVTASASCEKCCWYF